jgi:hypothetical protein
MAHPSKKATHNSSNGGGDKNRPRYKIDSSHKLPTRKKRKNLNKSITSIKNVVRLTSSLGFRFAANRFKG